MGEYPTDVPLLSTGDIASAFKMKRPFFKSAVKWVLKLLMWLVFITWVALMFFYPSEFVHNMILKFEEATQGTLFGLTGSILLAFTAPVLIIAFLSVPYLIISGEDEIQKKRSAECPSFRLWTFPVLVDGPFGVVSAAELIGIVLSVVFVIWSCAAYTLQSWSSISQSQLPIFDKSRLMLENVGIKLGLIGLFCLALLFLPISRGSLLLRLVDIPFEHATRYHVWLGHLTMSLFTLHGLFHVIRWAMVGQLLQEILDWKDIGVANLAGVVSLTAGLLIWVTSLEPVRKWNFELFLYTHQLYVVFVIFLALHVGDFIFSFAAGGIFLFMLDRYLRFIQSRKTIGIISATSLPCGVVELVIPKPANLRYNALSFVFLQVRELSWLQWHPFSVSSSPLDGNHHLSVLVKVLGDWTEKLVGKISNNHEEPQKLQQSQRQSLITASVEGPYGHDSPYYLTYKHLVLVAGGIGIAPFLAVLKDIFHRLKDGKSCMPQNILIVWAIKKSDELPILSMMNEGCMEPIFFNTLNLQFQIFVTQESEPKLEDGKTLRALNSRSYASVNRSAMSVLVGTGNNVWSGIYVVASTIGFILLLGLMDVFYINPYAIDYWWYKGLLLLLCMVTSVVTFGGLVAALWQIWEQKMLASEECDSGQSKSSNMVLREAAVWGEEGLVNLSNIQYGFRPDFNEIFGSISDRWGAVDVGVLVCGPRTLQLSVAKEIRSHSLRRRHNHPIFHFNSHSFDL